MYRLPLRFAAISLLFGASVAIAQVPDPKTLTFTRWTPDFEVPDPVAISLDNDGRAYVTRTSRRKEQDLDIRANKDWIPDDVGFTTVEDKIAFYHSQLSPERSDLNRKRVKDLNGDGVNDWKDLTVLSETIYRIVDSDNNGTADKINVFAEGFQTEVTGIAAGVLWHEGAVYTTIAPDVWRLTDDNNDGVADSRTAIAHGFGLHIAYAGHDMHGLTVGPDGRIYWSIGDKGISVLSREGKEFRYPNEGGVMRCEPDGSHFEVFAHGLRNVQELAFDDAGNLFSVDNDADFKGEMERFVYIVEGMDAGWRCNYQYRGAEYNPWTAEKIWQPQNESQAAFLVPAIRNYNNGPSGFAYNPGTALGPAYKGFFFLSQFPSGQQNAFRVKANGASFEMVDEHLVGKGVRAIGINFGPDGALYMVDWAGDYALNQKGAVWKVDDPKFAASPARLETAKLLREGMRDRDIPSLTALLAHADKRVRLAAQFELVRRTATAQLLAIATDAKAVSQARIQSLWGLGQLWRYKTDSNYAQIAGLVGDGDAEVRTQAAKICGDAANPTPVPMLLQLLKDREVRVQFHAAIALGRLRDEGAFSACLDLVRNAAAGDVYMRHAGTQALAGCSTAAQLKGLGNDKSEAVRLAAVIALRYQRDTAIADYLADASEAVVTEAARGIHDDLSIAEAMPALAASLLKSPVRSEAFIRRAVNANLRVGTPAAAAAVAQFAADPTAPEGLRSLALDALLEWLQPAVLDHVDGRSRTFGPRSRDEIIKAVELQVAALLKSTQPQIRQRALQVATLYKLHLESKDLLTIASAADLDAALRVEALRSLQADYPELFLQQAAKFATDKDHEVRVVALPMLAAINPTAALPMLQNALDKSKFGPEQQMALRELAGISLPAADLLISQWAANLTKGKVPPALQLDVLEAAERREKDVSAIAEQLAAFRKSHESDPLATFRLAAEGGSAKRGEDIVVNNLAASCIRCHQIQEGEGSTVGPNLKGIGLKPAAYLLESLIEPGAVVAPGYGMISLTLQDGSSVSGQFLKESKKSLELILPDQSKKEVPLAEIKTRSPITSMMPPMHLLLKPSEIRDVVAYLGTLKAGK